MSVIERLKSLLIDNYQLDEAAITESTSFVDDLHLDSLEQFEMIVNIEDEFDITIPEDKIESITTVRELVSVIENEVNVA